MNMPADSLTGLPDTRSQSRSRRRTWLKRGLLGLTVTVVTMAGIGAIYQAVATANDQRTYPPPGQLVDLRP